MKLLILALLLGSTAFADGGGHATKLTCQAKSLSGERININTQLEQGLQLSEDAWGDASGASVSSIDDQTFRHTLSIGYNNYRAELQVHIKSKVVIVSIHTLEKKPTVLSSSSINRADAYDSPSATAKTKDLAVKCVLEFVSYGG